MHLIISISFLLFVSLTSVYSQIDGASADKVEKIVSIAKEMMIEAGFCALITHDATGKINARMMEPFLPEDDLTVWFGTNISSRKVLDIKTNPNVTLYYAATDASGYIVVQGDASLFDDAELKQKYWMQSWEDFYKKDKSDYILIKVVAESMEILSTKHGITGDTTTWKVPSINFR